MVQEEDVIDALGKTTGMLLSVCQDERRFTAELLRTLLRGHLYQVASKEVAESVTEKFVGSFSQAYSGLASVSVEASQGSEKETSVLEQTCCSKHRAGEREETPILGELLQEKGPIREKGNEKGAKRDEERSILDEAWCSKELLHRLGTTLGSETPDKGTDSTLEIGCVNYVVEEVADNSGRTKELELVPFVNGRGSGGGAVAELWQESVTEQRRSNSLKELELVFAMKNLQLKERELEIRAESVDVNKETLGVRKSTLEFRVTKAADDALAADCERFRQTTSDYFFAGLLLMALFTGICVWKNIPGWFDGLKTSCNAGSDKEQERWYNWRPWIAVRKQTGYFLCMGKGGTGFAVGLGLSVVLLFICKKTLSSSRRGMPMTIFMIGGMGIGVIGRTVVDLIGGEGGQWTSIWLLIIQLGFLQVEDTIGASSIAAFGSRQSSKILRSGDLVARRNEARSYLVMIQGLRKDQTTQPAIRSMHLQP